jgi:hypothetical protein
MSVCQIPHHQRLISHTKRPFDEKKSTARTRIQDPSLITRIHPIRLSNRKGATVIGPVATRFIFGLIAVPASGVIARLGYGIMMLIKLDIDDGSHSTSTRPCKHPYLHDQTDQQYDLDGPPPKKKGALTIRGAQPDRCALPITGVGLVAGARGEQWHTILHKTRTNANAPQLVRHIAHPLPADGVTPATGGIELHIVALPGQPFAAASGAKAS